MGLMGVCRRTWRQSSSSVRVASVALAGLASLWSGGAMASTGIPFNGMVKFDGTGFNVMNVQLVLGSSLRFSNPGTKPLELRIVTWRGKLVRKLTVPAHGRASWTPKRYGVYDYLDAKTTALGNVTIKGSDGEKVYQPVGRMQGASYRAPGYGVVAVTNAVGGGIPLSSGYGSKEVSGKTTLTGKHHRVFMEHTPWMEVPGGTMTFKPWVLVVKAGQPVHVYNYDGMAHGVFPGDYPVMFLDRGQVRSYRYGFKGFVLPKNGGHRDITFHEVGMHHVLCVIHSYEWKHTYRSHHFYGGYPYVMDAVVVVEPASRA